MASPEDKKEVKQELLQAILDDLKKQSELKRELLQELKPSQPSNKLFEFSKHPIVLLIIGSILGGWLSSCYQQREWDRQHEVLTDERKYDRQRERDELSQKERIAQKSAIRDEALQAIVDTQAAMRTALSPLFHDDAKSFIAKEKDRLKAWEKANETWEVSRIRLAQKIELEFSPEAQKRFEEISEAKNQNGNYLTLDVTNLLEEARNNPQMLNDSKKENDQRSEAYKDFRKRIRKNVLEPLGDARKKATLLMQLMQDEIQSVVEPTPHLFPTHFLGCPSSFIISSC